MGPTPTLEAGIREEAGYGLNSHLGAPLHTDDDVC